MDEHCVAGGVGSLSSHYLDCIPCKGEETTSATMSATQLPSRRTAQARKSCLPDVLTKVIGVLLSQNLKANEERRMPKKIKSLCPSCQSCLLHLRCWATTGAIAPMINCMLFHWPNQEDDYRTFQTTSKPLFSLANNLGRKVAAMSIRHLEVEVARPCTLAPLLSRGQQLPPAGCGAVSWTAPAHLPQASTVLEINWGIFASFALARPGKRPARGSREYFLWKTPGTGKPWSEWLNAPRKALAQKHTRARVYTVLWVITLRWDFTSADKWARIYFFISAP